MTSAVPSRARSTHKWEGVLEVRCNDDGMPLAVEQLLTNRVFDFETLGVDASSELASSPVDVPRPNAVVDGWVRGTACRWRRCGR